MSTFSVGSFSSDETDYVLGQSFIPNVQGPNGTGDPSGATQAFMTSVSLGYPSGNLSGRGSKVYIYAVELTDPDQIGKNPYLVASSDPDIEDGSGLFGSNTFQRTFPFSSGALDPTKTYYLYFDKAQILRADDNGPYTGGVPYDDQLNELDGESLQFQIVMYT